jgi:hypothetical protein
VARPTATLDHAEQAFSVCALTGASGRSQAPTADKAVLFSERQLSISVEVRRF